MGVYQPWQANTKLTSANFWDEKTNDAVGIFIDKVEEWQDYEYAIWSSSDTLEVRYFYNNGLLSFKWPLVTGTRSTGLACYNHNKDKEVMENQEESIQKMRNDEIKYGSSYRINFNPLSYTSFLQNRYGTIDLNKVKDWILEYEDKAPRAPEVFEESSSRIEIETVEDLKKELYISPVSFLPVHGTRQNSGFAPVLTRRIERYVNGYNRLHHKLDEDERKRVEALLLLTSYSHADEEYMPMKNMLSGHPNFLSDVKSIPPLMSFLFPNHPMAGEWADEFEKFMELNTRFHTRDTIDEYELQGGRWTENLGTYLWAFLTPAIRANYLLRNYYDGRNRFAKKDIKKIGNWALNALTAPFVGEEPGTIDKSHHHSWGKVEKGEKKRRVHPPQGAHSFRRKHPRLMWLLGKQMRKFDPLLAEYIFWVSRADEDRFGHESGEENDPWKFMYEEESDNPGTNPHLESSKFTGYGIVLRSAVDTEDEVSVHLQQIDNGPNYRWGIAGQGGCGVIYYYAAGKAYSDNGSEDIGDRPCHDTDFCTNFGVWKDNRYKSIGRNVLHRPFYDFDSAQFGEIVSSRENEYSWPQYQSRSVMLAGSDYIITYDAVYSDELAHRWSWFVRESDEMPNIYMIKGQGRTAGRSSRKTSISNDSDNTKGVWYDGRGDCMAVVTHKDGLEVEATEYGCKVKKDSENKDYVFQNREELEYVDADIKFRGKAGIIRKKSNNIELNLFHGSLLGTEDIILEVDNEDLGINLNYSKKNDLTGSYFTREESELKITYPQGLPDDVNVYLDGKGIKTDREENTLRMKLESGEHKLQITESDKPVPVKPEIVGTVNSSNQARVFWSKSAGAESYRIEISYDSGASFEKIGETEETEYLLTDLENGEKIHVRVTARNDSYESEPADEYPVYVTKEVPLPPDGLNLDLKEGEVSLNWGKVLGVSKYRLYRRKKGNENYSLIYEGNEQDFIDKGVNTVPAFSEPGVYAEKLDIDESEYMVYEYAVSSVNGNGEGEKSTCINTDPTSWINWEPTIK
ncbi:MAG: fibronectin type III domain-containing protein [bacterium]